MFIYSERMRGFRRAAMMVNNLTDRAVLSESARESSSQADAGSAEPVTGPAVCQLLLSASKFNLVSIIRWNSCTFANKAG